MKLAELLSKLDSQPIAASPQSAMIVGYLNSALTLTGDACITSATTGAQAIALIYQADPSIQEKVFLKDFAGVRDSDSYKFTIVILTVMAVIAGVGFESAPEVIKLLVQGILEIAKTNALGS